MRDMLWPHTVLERNKRRLEAIRNQVDIPENHRASPEQLAPYIVQIEDCIREAEAMLTDTFNFENLDDGKNFQRLMNHAQLLVSSAFNIQPINKYSEVRSELEGMKQQPLKALSIANKTRSAQAKLNYAQWQAWADLVWKENPHWNKFGVALHIIEEHKINAKPGTVADQLIKPKPD